MTDKNDVFTDITERIDEVFCQIDNDVCAELRKYNKEYATLWRETCELSKKYPIIEQTCEGGGENSLTAEEHAALSRYLKLKMDMDDIERKQIYYRGHMDCFAYLKKIGGV